MISGIEKKTPSGGRGEYGNNCSICTSARLLGDRAQKQAEIQSCTLANNSVGNFKGPPSTDRLFYRLFSLWKFALLIVTIWLDEFQLWRDFHVWMNCSTARNACGFHSRDQQPCISTKTKEDVSIIIGFNSRRIGSGHQHGRHFIVWGHQHGGRDVMWNPRIPLGKEELA